jgi:hypothetical protein
VLDHQLYYYLKRCFLLKNMDKVPQDEVGDWEWLKGGDTNSSLYNGFYSQTQSGGLTQGAAVSINESVRGSMYDNVSVDCDDGQFIEEAFNRFGFSDPQSTFCKLSFTFNTTTGGLGGGKDGRGAGSTEQACMSGFDSNSDFDGYGDYGTQASALDSLLSQSSKYNKAKGALTPEEEYVRTYRTFMNGCKINLVEPYTTGKASNNNTLYKVTIVNKDGTTEDWLGQGETDNTSQFLVATLDSKYAQFKTCGELAQGTVKLAASYQDYVKKHPDESFSVANTAQGGATRSCFSEGGLLSWILCPILTAVDETLDWLDQQINQLLFVDARYYSTSNIGGSWAAMRNIAYLVLIPMMLLMVIGTAIGFGPFDAYTVKKALPRMLVAVIFISLSLPITQLAVIVSNDTGNGIGHFITSTVPKDKKVDSLRDIFKGYTKDSSAGSDFGLGLASLVALGAGFAVGLTLLSFAAVAAVGLLIGFTVLVMRQVLLVALIVIAPIAILAWIFPGNDKLWGIWKTTFIAMLMMYPLISILIAAGKFVAGISG